MLDKGAVIALPYGVEMCIRDRYRTVLRKADDHFVNREWQEAVTMYDVLLERRPGRVKTYVDREI